MNRTLWIYWENKPGVRRTPPHIVLCRWIMEYTARGYEVRLVTPETLRHWLPDFPSRLDAIRLRPRGRIEKYLKRRQRRLRAIAVRVDYIRAFLLEKYGGLWIDSDAIVLRDLGPTFDDVENSEFLATRRSSFGRTHVSVNFYGSLPGGQIIAAYCRQLTERLGKSLDYHYNEAGAAMLTHIVDANPNACKILEEKTIQPITFEEAERKFASTSIEPSEIIGEHTLVCMLYNGLFLNTFKNKSLSELYKGEWLLSKIYRKVLPEAEFESLLASYRQDPF